jgi:hypothetical protein
LRPNCFNSVKMTEKFTGAIRDSYSRKPGSSYQIFIRSVLISL